MRFIAILILTIVFLVGCRSVLVQDQESQSFSDMESKDFFDLRSGERITRGKPLSGFLRDIDPRVINEIVQIQSVRVGPLQQFEGERTDCLISLEKENCTIGLTLKSESDISKGDLIRLLSGSAKKEEVIVMSIIIYSGPKRFFRQPLVVVHRKKHARNCICQLFSGR